jgi:hypothetical protein
MPKLVIKRSSEYNNSLRNYGIYIDGEKADTIANGETKELTITTGRHTLYFKIDWCSSPEVSFDITDSDIKSVLVGGFKNGSWMVPAAGGIILLSYLLERLFGIYYLFFLAIPAFLVIVYYITIGRKKYLTLKEGLPGKSVDTDDKQTLSQNKNN